MQRRRLGLSKKWLILGLTFLLVPLFQNMSLLDEGVDIRDLAPRKPAGSWNSPGSDYVPQNVTGHSLNDVGQSLLDHNFGDQLKTWEVSLLGKEKRTFGGLVKEEPGLQNDSLGQWKLGLITPTKLRLSYETSEHFKFICEAQGGEQGLKLRMSQPLTTRLSFDLVHQTGAGQSQFQIDYNW